MKFSKKCGLVLMFLGAASVSLQGCVRLNLETRESCIGLPEALPFEQQAELKYKIKVSRFEYSAGGIGKNVEIDAGKVDGFFEEATKVVRCGEGNEDAAECSEVDDVQGDFACKVTLERKGSDTTIPTFTLPTDITQGMDEAAVAAAVALGCAGDGEICSERDLQAVWNADPAEGVKVVHNVRYCDEIREGDPETGMLGPTLIGCAQLPGRSMAVERLNYEPPEGIQLEGNSIEGILWPHEFGHTKGLYHPAQSCASNNDPQALMLPEIWTANATLNAQECFGFRGGQP